MFIKLKLQLKKPYDSIQLSNFLLLYNMKSQTDNKSNMKNTSGEISDIREKDDIFKTADEGSRTITNKKIIPASQSGVDEVIFQDLDEMVVNLDSKGKENNFLKLKITLEVSDKESLEVIKK
ncbi:MAG: hypothetical protein MRQ13_04070 [Candidatus Midichloria sp.]|nr:hypothetical protein [Candidatus Midichloria sp.]